MVVWSAKANLVQVNNGGRYKLEAYARSNIVIQGSKKNEDKTLILNILNKTRGVARNTSCFVDQSLIIRCLIINRLCAFVPPNLYLI
jgi:hypothetical protein